MKRAILAAALTAAVTTAGAQAFPVEFWPATPDRTRQVQHFFSCPVGFQLVIERTTLPPIAAIGAFVFVNRPQRPYQGLYKITNIAANIDVDGFLRSVTITAICTTGLPDPDELPAGDSLPAPADRR